MSTETLNIILLILILCIFAGAIISNGLFSSRSMPEQYYKQASREVPAYYAQFGSSPNSMWPFLTLALTVIIVFLYFRNRIEEEADKLDRKIAAQESPMTFDEIKNNQAAGIAAPRRPIEDELMTYQDSTGAVITKEEPTAPVYKFEDTIGQNSILIQVHSFSSYRNALSAFLKLEEELGAVVYMGLNNNHDSYKVLVGSFATKAEAVRFKQDHRLDGYLRSINGLGQIVKNPTEGIGMP